LNQPPNDLPNAVLTRWLSYIRLFDFDVKHVAGTKNGGADALSRRGKAPEDSDEDENEVDDFFEAQLYSISLSERNTYDNPIARIYLHKAKYEDDDLILGQYLETLQRPDGLTDIQFRELRRKSKNFLVRDGYLFKKPRIRG